MHSEVPIRYIPVTVRSHMSDVLLVITTVLRSARRLVQFPAILCGRAGAGGSGITIPILTIFAEALGGS